MGVSLEHETHSSTRFSVNSCSQPTRLGYRFPSARSMSSFLFVLLIFLNSRNWSPIFDCLYSDNDNDNDTFGEGRHAKLNLALRTRMGEVVTSTKRICRSGEEPTQGV